MTIALEFCMKWHASQLQGWVFDHPCFIGPKVRQFVPRNTATANGRTFGPRVFLTHVPSPSVPCGAFQAGLGKRLGLRPERQQDATLRRLGLTRRRTFGFWLRDLGVKHRSVNRKFQERNIRHPTNLGNDESRSVTRADRELFFARPMRLRESGE